MLRLLIAGLLLAATPLVGAAVATSSHGQPMTLQAALGRDYVVESIVGGMRVTWKPALILTESSVLPDIAATIHIAGKWMKDRNAWPSDGPFVQIWAELPTLDRYGNAGRGVALRLRWHTDDLKQINYDNLPILRMLEFATLQRAAPAGLVAAAGHCLGSDKKETPSFCQQVVARAQERSR